MSAPRDVWKKPSGCASPLATPGQPWVGSRQPLAASSKGERVKRRLFWKQPRPQAFAEKRSQANTRVQSYGVRVACSTACYLELKAVLAQERKKQTQWRPREWQLKVEEIAEMGWGALQHVGYRSKRTSAVFQPSCAPRDSRPVMCDDD